MRVFVSGPYGDKNPEDIIQRNVDKAGQTGRDLMAMGYQVYVPHTMSHGWEKDKRLTTEQFYKLDKSFLRFWAEAIYRIPGDSVGADAEMALAKELGLVILMPI